MEVIFATDIHVTLLVSMISGPLEFVLLLSNYTGELIFVYYMHPISCKNVYRVEQI